MRFLTQAIKKKMSKSQDKVAVSATCRVIYGLIIALAKKDPEFIAWASREIDRLPKDREAFWYLGAVRGLVGEWEQMKREQEARQRANFERKEDWLQDSVGDHTV